MDQVATGSILMNFNVIFHLISKNLDSIANAKKQKLNFPQAFKVGAVDIFYT